MSDRNLSAEHEGGPDNLAAGRGFLVVAWQRKLLIALSIAVALAAGTLYYNEASPVYESTAQILVVKKRPDTVTGMDTRNLAIEDYVATHQALLKSQ